MSTRSPSAAGRQWPGPALQGGGHPLKHRERKGKTCMRTKSHSAVQGHHHCANWKMWLHPITLLTSISDSSLVQTYIHSYICSTVAITSLSEVDVTVYPLCNTTRLCESHVEDRDFVAQCPAASAGFCSENCPPT